MQYNENMSEEDKKEYEEIQAEIAASKGLKPDGTPLNKEGDQNEDDKEEVETKTDEDDQKDDKDPEDDDSEEEDKVDDTKVRNPQNRIPLSKLQDFKAKSREEKAALITQLSEKDTEIETLKRKLETTTSSEDRKKKVDAYVEKHGGDPEMVQDLLDLIPTPAIDPSLTESAKLIQVEAKKIEAQKAFDNEFASLLDDTPDAAEFRDQIRKEAYKEENLNKSLYEVFNRFVKPNAKPKVKGGESSRPNNRVATTDTGNDIDKIIERVEKGESGALNGLSDDVLDKVFDRMEKKGSRYTRSS